MIAAAPLAWLRHLAVDGDLLKAEPKTLRNLHTTARLARSDRRLASPQPGHSFAAVSSVLPVDDLRARGYSSEVIPT